MNLFDNFFNLPSIVKVTPIQYIEWDINKSIIITEVSPDEFPHETFTMFLKQRGGSLESFTCPAKVRLGMFRENIYYVVDDIWFYKQYLYVARYDGLFKIENTSQDVTRLCRNNQLVDLYTDFIKTSQDLRHKPIYEIRELVIAKKELDQL